VLLATFLMTDRLWSFCNVTPFVFGVKTPFVSRRDVRVCIEGSGTIVVSGVVVVDPQWCAWKTTFLVSISNSQSWGVGHVWGDRHSLLSSG
jgi:hypothetical protein